jgi:hypothetical protein
MTTLIPQPPQNSKSFYLVFLTTRGEEHKKHKRRKKNVPFLAPFVLLVFLPFSGVIPGGRPILVGYHPGEV